MSSYVEELESQLGLAPKRGARRPKRRPRTSLKELLAERDRLVLELSRKRAERGLQAGERRLALRHQLWPGLWLHAELLVPESASYLPSAQPRMRIGHTDLGTIDGERSGIEICLEGAP